MTQIMTPKEATILFVFIVAAVLYFGTYKSLEEEYNEKYNICGAEYVDKEVGGFVGTVLEPSLFIYLLQDKKSPNKLKISVSQKNGYSINEIIIYSDIIDPIKIMGKGRYWGDKISSGFSVDSEKYDKEIIVPSEKFKFPLVFRIGVTYNWIWRGKSVSHDEFVSKSGRVQTTLFVTSENCSRVPGQ